MIIHYSEVTFAIDLIKDSYKTNNPEIIRNKVKEDLDINLKLGQVTDYLDHKEDYEKESNSISMKEHFKELEYE